MLNKTLYSLLCLAILTFTLLAQAKDDHPDSTNVATLSKIKLGSNCCYRQRVAAGTTQGTCPKGSYVIYAEARTRPFQAPAIWYRCETVQVVCSVESPAICAQKRAAS